ncbi:MAG: hypothetical protein R3C49_02995 [Planctomycetaceae bacterium]
MTFSYCDFHDAGGKVFLKLACHLAGMMYDRLQSVDPDVYLRLNVPDYQFEIPQLVVASDVLECLLSAIGTWQSHREVFEMTIGSLNEQRCTFGLEIRDDFVCNQERPVAVLGYCCHRAVSEVRFVVDSTCLLQFAEGLRKIVRFVELAGGRGEHQ